MARTERDSFTPPVSTSRDERGAACSQIGKFRISPKQARVVFLHVRQVPSPGIRVNFIIFISDAISLDSFPSRDCSALLLILPSILPNKHPKHAFHPCTHFLSCIYLSIPSTSFTSLLFSKLSLVFWETHFLFHQTILFSSPSLSLNPSSTISRICCCCLTRRTPPPRNPGLRI